MSKMTLFSAFATGQTITIKSRAGVKHTGIIQTVGLESGFTFPDQPRHFNVWLRTATGIQEVYIYTID